MISIWFQIIGLVIFFTVLIGLSNPKWLKFILALIGTLLITTEYGSLMMSNSLIDYKFYAHFNPKVVQDTGDFFYGEWLKIGLFILALSTYFWLIRDWGKKYSKWLLIGLGSLILIPLCLEGGAISEIIKIRNLHYAKKVDFEVGLQQLNIDDYITRDQLSASLPSKPKNMIFIALESLEESFLKPNLAHLTPNLNRLKKEMTYYKMKEHEGANYTIGALYTYFTGFPMFFKQHGNDIFSNVLETKILGLPDVLTKAGYFQQYMLGNADFAGARNMFEMMGMKVKSEDQFDPKYTVKNWGLHDKDLFELAYKELDTLNQKDQPFALYISNIGSHSPDGVFDSRMTKILPPQPTQLKLMTAAADYHIGNLLDTLEARGMMDETAIFIMPDHTLMGNQARVLKEFEEPRDLYLITNTTSDSYTTDESIYQLDVPRLILEGLDIKHNLPLLTDKIQENKGTFVKDNRKRILQVNESSLTYRPKPNAKEVAARKKAAEDMGDPNKIKLVSNSYRYNNKADSYFYLGTQKHKLSKGLNIIELDSTFRNLTTYDVQQNEVNATAAVDHLERLINNRSRFAVILHGTSGYEMKNYADRLQKLRLYDMANLGHERAYVMYSNLGYSSERLGGRSLTIELPLKEKKSINTLAEIDARAKNLNKWIAHAGGAIGKDRYTNSLEALDHNYQKGFRLFELDIITTSDDKFVATHDWIQWRDNVKYGGDVPPTYDQFMSVLAGKKYTPLDMKMINEWFRTHPDAILVTDKINDVERFVGQFVDRKRLMMELFSLEAIATAQKLGIKEAIISEKIWGKLGEYKVKRMKELGINALAMSRKTVDKFEWQFEQFRKAGIKVYAYHVGNDELYDEAHMVRLGLDNCYGLYADYWHFEN